MFKWNALRQFVRSSFGSGGVIRRQVRRGMVSAQAVQALEARQLLSSTLNQGWRDISALTVSFAPDGTTVDGNASQLNAKLDALAPRAVWQQTILDAFQSWAQHANLNVGVVADGGQAFGTVGNYMATPASVMSASLPLHWGLTSPP
jgi:ABC-type transporter Mla subunit MlaD